MTCVPEKFRLTMFRAEYWEWVADLPEEIHKYEPDHSGQHDIHILALWHWNAVTATTTSNTEQKPAIIQWNAKFHHLSVLTDIFQVNLGYRCLLKQRLMEVVVTTGLLELLVMQSSSQIITTNKPTSSFFTGQMPFLSPNQQCQSTEGENITFHGLAYPELTWGSSNFVSDH